MPRTITIPANDYDAGSYGPFEVNGFASANTDWLDISFSVSGWPTATALITGSIRWSNGDGADFSINSPPRDRQGNLLPAAVIRVGVPRRGNGKAAVNTATATMVLAAPIRTAITFSAVAS